MLELKYPAKPDEHGVINGVHLAQAIIHDAANLLVPYVRGCPSCLDDLFSRLANEVLEAVHRELKAGNKTGFTYALGADGPEKDAAVQAHLAANVEAVRAMLEGTEAHHH